MQCPKCKGAQVGDHPDAGEGRPLKRCPACGYQFLHATLRADKLAALSQSVDVAKGVEERTG